MRNERLDCDGPWNEDEEISEGEGEVSEEDGDSRSEDCSSGKDDDELPRKKVKDKSI
jgi:hypothetical protein